MKEWLSGWYWVGLRQAFLESFPYHCRDAIIGWWLYRITKEKNPSTGLIISVALILAGAFGNILDSAFYGLIFNESTYMQVASLFPPEGGYAISFTEK